MKLAAAAVSRFDALKKTISLQLKQQQEPVPLTAADLKKLHIMAQEAAGAGGEGITTVSDDAIQSKKKKKKKSADAAADPEAEGAWDSEIHDRIRAIDDGRVTGVAYEDVMRAAEKRLIP